MSYSGAEKMKRKIFIALVAMTAVSLTTVSATNPFTDVDTNHWSYASFNKLASDGIIDGYGDGTLRGERTMTRYEMAQIVAKALARSDKLGAEQKTALNKLAAEYGAELNNLGVRVGSL